MSDASEKAERCQRILGELTELGLTLARDLHARALSAETTQDAQALSLAFQRVSRSVRQSLALEAKMEREAQVAAREAQTRAHLQQVGRAGDLKRRVGVAMNRLIWTEADGDEDEAEALDDDLTARLDEMALAEDFLEIPLETLVAQLTADMGLGAAPDAEAPAGEKAWPVGSAAWATGRAPHDSA